MNPRIRAQWRQIDREHTEAVAVRREWMALMGCDLEEIEEVIEESFDLSLVSELENLVAAKSLADY